MLLLIAFSLVFIVQSYFYLFLFRKYTSYQQAINLTPAFSVSVVVCAKNEAENLKKILPSLALQDHTSFEIILIDDASTDKTLNEMLAFEKAHLNSAFKVTIIPIKKRDSNGKKTALAEGILAAQYPYVLLTDADCQPASKRWISHMSAYFSEKTAIVLGYGAYEKTNNSFLNKLIRFETLLTALQYFSYALNGKPYMGVGRNLAYKKEAFIKAGGFNEHAHIKSGDDDLFVSQIASHTNTSICDHKESFTLSKPHTHLKQWIRQKRRHITTATHYRFETKFLLSLFFFSQFSLYALLLTSLLTETFTFIIIPLFLIRLIFWYGTINKTANRLNEKDLIAFGPLYEISIIFIQLYIFLKNIISPPKHW